MTGREQQPLVSDGIGHVEIGAGKHAVTRDDVSVHASLPADTDGVSSSETPEVPKRP
jgi:hypothetical protein